MPSSLAAALASLSNLDMRAEKGSIRRPAGVTFTPRACRWNRSTPSSSSNALTRAVTLDCTVFSSAAAQFMLPCRATASKTFRSVASITCPIFKSEGFGIHALERMIIMIQAARFTRLNPGLFCPISSGEQDRLSQGISRNNTAIAKTDIGAMVMPVGALALTKCRSPTT